MAVILVQYLGPYAQVSQMVDKFELVYNTMASFNILMQYFYRLQQVKTERVPAYVTHMEGALSTIQKDYPYMLSPAELQNHYDFLHYLCDDPCISYPQLVTVAQKAKSEQEDKSAKWCQSQSCSTRRG